MTEQYELRDDYQPSSISFNVDQDQEWIRITNEGFWVRGVKVPQNNKEAQTVYNAFKQWLAWANLTRRY